MKLKWYFDVISPFAYLQHELFLRDHPDLKLEYKPVLLAGLLSHWGSKGPAEVPMKRLFTYKHTLWMARRFDIEMSPPPGHPFNPLRALRLILLAGCKRNVVTKVFRHIWREGRGLDNGEFAELAASLGIEDAANRIGKDDVKSALRKNTDEALRRGLFGVPTAVVGDEIFWGLDATEMLLAYLKDPTIFDDKEMKRIKNLPMLASRF